MRTSRMSERADAVRDRRFASAARTLSGALGAWIGFAGSVAFIGGLLTDMPAVAVAAMPAVLVGMAAEAAGRAVRRGAIRRRRSECYAD